LMRVITSAHATPPSRTAMLFFTSLTRPPTILTPLLLCFTLLNAYQVNFHNIYYLLSLYLYTSYTYT
jgi:hypothetical protein